MKRTAIIAILIFAFLGLSDAAYLTQSELTGKPLICIVQGLTNCNVVANSSYSRLFGIPLAEYGVIFYGLLFMFSALELFMPNRMMRRALQGVALLGVLTSAYFTYVQIFLIGALCMYCSVSAALALLSFVAALFVEPIRAPFQKSIQTRATYLPMPPEV
jgi:uncharacterized membrane protein